MSVKFIRKVFLNPFSTSSEPVTKIEVVEVEKILYYSKRKKVEERTNYDVFFKIIKFDIIGNNLEEKLKEWGLSIWEYLSLLLEQPKEVQEKYNYSSSETMLVSFSYFIQDQVIENDIRCIKLMGKILSELNIPHTVINDNIIRSVIEDVDVVEERLEEFKECCVNPYLRK